MRQNRLTPKCEAMSSNHGINPSTSCEVTMTDTMANDMNTVDPRQVLIPGVEAGGEVFAQTESPLYSLMSSTSSHMANESRSCLGESIHSSSSVPSNSDIPSRRSSASIAPKLFACPYFKRDPLRYSARNSEELAYRSCATVLLRNTAQVKQHLYRVHKRPDHYCERCARKCENALALNTHLCEASCQLQDVKYEGKMTLDQYTKIRKRQSQTDQRTGWYEIYNILFAGAFPPSTPYLEDHANQDSLHHMAGLFRSLGFERAQELYDTITGRGHTRPLAHLLPPATRLVMDEAYDFFLRHYSDEFSCSLQDATSQLDTSLAFMTDYDRGLSFDEIILENDVQPTITDTAMGPSDYPDSYLSINWLQGYDEPAESTSSVGLERTLPFMPYE